LQNRRHTANDKGLKPGLLQGRLSRP
jgi:hypothetical protein